MSIICNGREFKSYDQIDFIKNNSILKIVSDNLF